MAEKIPWTAMNLDPNANALAANYVPAQAAAAGPKPVPAQKTLAELEDETLGQFFQGSPFQGPAPLGIVGPTPTPQSPEALKAIAADALTSDSPFLPKFETSESGEPFLNFKGMDPEDEAEFKSYMAQGEDYGKKLLAMQQQDVEAERGQMQAYSQLPQQLDLSPLMALTDQWTGSRMAQSYKRPTSVEDRVKTMGDMQSNITQGQRGVTQTQLQQFKEGMDNREKLLQMKQKEELLKLRTAENRRAQSGGSSKGQDAVDRVFAKDYVEWGPSGGYSIVQKNLSSLDDAMKQLSMNSKLTGPAVGAIPEGALNKTFPEAAALEQQVREVVMGNMRLILGTQFTEKEGERVLRNSWDRSLPVSENIKKIQRGRQQMLEMAKAKNAASEYFEANGFTLRGFKGKKLDANSLADDKKFKPKKSAAEMSDDEVKAAFAEFQKANKGK